MCHLFLEWLFTTLNVYRSSMGQIPIQSRKELRKLFCAYMLKEPRIVFFQEPIEESIYYMKYLLNRKQLSPKIPIPIINTCPE